jgi:hypothetical protein
LAPARDRERSLQSARRKPAAQFSAQEMKVATEGVEEFAAGGRRPAAMFPDVTRSLAAGFRIAILMVRRL